MITSFVIIAITIIILNRVELLVKRWRRRREVAALETAMINLQSKMEARLGKRRER